MDVEGRDVVDGSGYWPSAISADIGALGVQCSPMATFSTASGLDTRRKRAPNEAAFATVCATSSVVSSTAVPSASLFRRYRPARGIAYPIACAHRIRESTVPSRRLQTVGRVHV